AAEDRTVLAWDASTGRRLGPPLKHQNAVIRLAFSAGGDRLVTVTRSVTYEVRIHTWEIATAKAASGPLTTQTAPLSDVVFSADGRLVATADQIKTKAGARGALTVWELAAARPVFTAVDVPVSVTKVRFSPDGRRVAAAGADGMARVWDCANGKEITQVRHGAPMLHLAFSADGGRLVTAGEDGAARIWDAAVGKELTTLKHGRAFTHAVPHGPFGRGGFRAAAAGAENPAGVGDAARGKARGPPLRHGGKVTQASLSPDGRLILTASADRAVRIWDLAS